MITVAGFNTAIDRRVDVDVLRPGAVQRADAAQAAAGGKGVHVAQMAVELGEPARLVGLGDAAHADLFARHLQRRGVEWHPVAVAGTLRQCLAVHESDGRTTEVLESGMTLDESTCQQLLDVVHALLDTTDVLVLSGSLPAGFPVDTYAGLVVEAKRRQLPCLVDTSGDPLEHALAARPWLIKPNADEATVLAGEPVDDEEPAFDCVRRLHELGVARPVVTLGAQGAIGFDGCAFWQAQSDVVAVRNSVGSGDCFLAAMAVGAARGEAFDISLRRAVACGAANAESDETGFADAASVCDWMARVHIEKLSAAGAVRQSKGGT